MSVDITGCNPEEASRKVGSELAMALSREQRQEQEQTVGRPASLLSVNHTLKGRGVTSALQVFEEPHGQGLASIESNK
jgi:hypothetical protein